jgi:uncharacterized repeat protein (TIGR03803 family)
MKTHIGKLFVLPVLITALVMLALGARAAVVFTTLYSFTGTNDGANPQAALVQGSDGYFYGTTYNGGTNGVFEHGQFYGYGTVFKISTNNWALTTLYSFTGGSAGAWPMAGLVLGTDGYFYGTTSGMEIYWGNSYGNGTVFKISTNGGLTTLYSFGSITNASGCALDGENPTAAMVQGSDGNFYGTTQWGGATNYNDGWGTYGYGTVFKISANGVLTTLYRFGSVQDTNGVPLDGAAPNRLVQGSDGNFYGATQWGGTNGWGTVFKISTNGVLSSLYSFTGGYGGWAPRGLVQGNDGNFYGIIMVSSVMDAVSAIFQISTNGALTILYSGDYYSYILGQGSDGDFYGTTYMGGFSGCDNVFKFSLNGALTILYSFGSVQDTNGVPLDGACPNGLVQGSDGSFYGTTTSARYRDAYGGTVFRLTIVPDPQLTIIPSGLNMILTWPTNQGAYSFAGYTLQSTTNLGPSAIWIKVASEPVIIGGQKAVINPISGTQQFFRLSQ